PHAAGGAPWRHRDAHRERAVGQLRRTVPLDRASVADPLQGRPLSEHAEMASRRARRTPGRPADAGVAQDAPDDRRGRRLADGGAPRGLSELSARAPWRIIGTGISWGVVMNVQATPAGARERSLDEVKAEVIRRAGRVNPLEGVLREEVEEIV